jgi:Na+/proline symporter
MLMLFKGVIASATGPAPNYDMQKILATRNPREAALMSGFVSVVLFPVRYLMIAGFAILGLLYYDKLNLIVAGKIDFEQILPSAINEFAPVGLMGCLLAGLLAAFLGTFAGTLNAAQAYLVNDLYLKYIHPDAGNRRITVINYVSGICIVVVSVVIGFFSKDVNSLLQWIVSGLYGGYVASNFLKWYWWRFNGHGYFWGMVAGLVPALIFSKAQTIADQFGLNAFPSLYAMAEALQNNLPLYYFPILLLLSIVGCLLGTWLTPPTDDKTLMSFYRTVRLWGFWKPVHDKVAAADPAFRRNADFYRDAFNIVIGIIWQTALVLLPIYVVLMNWKAAALVAGIIALTSLILKFNWYDRLSRENPNPNPKPL